MKYAALVGDPESYSYTKLAIGEEKPYIIDPTTLTFDATEAGDGLYYWGVSTETVSSYTIGDQSYTLSSNYQVKISSNINQAEKNCVPSAIYDEFVA